MQSYETPHSSSTWCVYKRTVRTQLSSDTGRWFLSYSNPFAILGLIPETIDCQPFFSLDVVRIDRYADYNRQCPIIIFRQVFLCVSFHLAHLNSCELSSVLLCIVLPHRDTNTDLPNIKATAGGPSPADYRHLLRFGAG